MPSSTIRRQMKNMVNNYSEAEKKVREATSNDPWGPSSSLMSEIADLTYNVVAFSEIMSMIWKRLNDHGKNWRHVYKALTLLDYLIKTGSERVALQCKENIFAIQTLKDFQYIDRDGKDQGINVREKSKQLVVLLKDDERLKGALPGAQDQGAHGAGAHQRGQRQPDQLRPRLQPAQPVQQLLGGVRQVGGLARLLPRLHVSERERKLGAGAGPTPDQRRGGASAAAGPGHEP
ncbi:hypothetical protein ANANG_G00291000 [Anguilla anguilla]|uniref:ENTH domain-containing protein n=1 Tax=Anguilla anguilla TaxID=7936 RepID=A0A9D3RLT8_ANGAN|nr:hypothetical protein ANANG_G00291000 [Anguilla anguilla]